MTAQSHTGPVADGEGKSERDELATKSVTGLLSSPLYPIIAYPCQDDRIIVVAHFPHHPKARDQSQGDEGGRKREEDDSDDQDCRPSILHRQSRCVSHGGPIVSALRSALLSRRLFDGGGAFVCNRFCPPLLQTAALHLSCLWCVV